MENSKGIKSVLIILIIICLLIASGVVYYFLAKNKTQKPIVCTQEAKICPDGSTISRTGPNCEFVACPSAKTNEDAPTITCSDSDGGENYYVKGATISNNKYSGGTKIDFCGTAGNGTLFEYWCINGGEPGYPENLYITVNTYQCPNGCKNGACIGSEITSPISGEKWERGKTYNIEWISNGLDYPISVQAITENYGETNPDCQVVFGSDDVNPFLGEYSLNIPTDACLGRYKIRICKFDKTNFEKSICDESDNYFQILDQRLEWNTYINYKLRYQIKYPLHLFVQTPGLYTDNSNTYFYVSPEDSTLTGEQSYVRIQIGENPEALKLENWVYSSYNSLLSREGWCIQEIGTTLRLTSSCDYHTWEYKHDLASFGTKVVIISTVGSSKKFNLFEISKEIISTLKFLD